MSIVYSYEVLPSARKGIITAVILGMGRIIGDTAIVWLLLGGSIRMTVQKLGTKKKIENIIIQKLIDANLYDEIADRLYQSALRISGGQQQRLCIARMLTIDPELILFDEPCPALDPISTNKIEDLLMQLKKTYTIVIVTHNIEQARRIADDVAFFYEGKVVENGPAKKYFCHPRRSFWKGTFWENFYIGVYESYKDQCY